MDLPGASQWHLSVGNLNLDITIILNKLPSPDESVFVDRVLMGVGGSASNYSIAVARLGHRSSLIAVAGGDALKLGLLTDLERLNVDVSRVRIANGYNTGVVVVLSIPSESSRSMIISRGANILLNPDDIPHGIGDHIHFSSVRPRLILDACNRINKSISYDPGSEAFRAGEGFSDAVRCVDILFINRKELERITGHSEINSLYRIIDGRLNMIVIKAGVSGALVVSPEASYSVDTPRGVRVMDVTGAGDAFNAAFNVWWKAGYSIEDSLRAGVAAGAAKVARVGGSNMPVLSEVIKMLERVPPARPLRG